jgi:release factor glutamine methyltransferase
LAETRVKHLLKQAIFDLEGAGIVAARLDAELLLGHCLGRTRTELYLGRLDQVEFDRASFFNECIDRRAAHEPIAYIIGEREFWSLPFFVTPDVLIPRPETEFLLEMILARTQHGPGSHCLDLCCGSGVISVILARELKAQVVSVDISPGALEVARRNCARHDVLDTVQLVQADLGSCLQEGADFSLIASNPPYVSSGEIADDLDPEVRDFEPHLALDGGSSGLEVIERIRDQLPTLLGSGGDCFIEIGAGQGKQVREMFLSNSSGRCYEFVEILKDYGRRDRVAHIRKTPISGM